MGKIVEPSQEELSALKLQPLIHSYANDSQIVDSPRFGSTRSAYQHLFLWRIWSPCGWVACS